jgi:hypothetical protein
MSQTGQPFDPDDPDANKNRDIAKALVAKYNKASEEIDPEDFNPKKHPRLDKRARGETAEFEDWVDNTVNPKEEKEPVVKEEPVKEEIKVTFEDIKPFIEQHLKEGGDKTTAIKTAIENFNADKLKESRGKIVESIKSKADDHAQNIAGVEGEVARIAQLANYQ